MRIALYSTRQKRRYLVVSVAVLYNRESFQNIWLLTLLIHSRLFGWKFVSVHCMLAVTQATSETPRCFRFEIFTGFNIFAGTCTFREEVRSMFLTCLSATFSRKLFLGTEQMQQALPVGNTTHKMSARFLSNGL